MPSAGADVSRFLLRGAALNDGQIPYRVMSDGKRGLCAFTCFDPSEGFIDMETIMEARREMSDYTWRMEYTAYFPPDSEGFFRRSILDRARAYSTFGPILLPRKGCLYAIGVDPAHERQLLHRHLRD